MSKWRKASIRSPLLAQRGAIGIGLKGQQLSAQGNALGTRHASNVALKGQKLWLSMLLPFQGDFCYNIKTQGDALGYVLVGLSGRPPSPLLQQPNAFLEQGTVEVILGDVEQAVQLFHAKFELIIG